MSSSTALPKISRFIDVPFHCPFDRKLSALRHARCLRREVLGPLASGVHLSEAPSVDWAILKNPVYAGAFAYGRTSTRSRIIEGRARKTAGDSVPMEQWVGTISFWYSTG